MSSFSIKILTVESICEGAKVELAEKIGTPLVEVGVGFEEKGDKV